MHNIVGRSQLLRGRAEVSRHHPGDGSLVGIWPEMEWGGRCSSCVLPAHN